jgi:hypothetical protein
MMTYLRIQDCYKKYCCFILLSFICIICHAQNFIPNGDFEQYNYCPAGLGQLNYAMFWFQPTMGSSDYFNQCSTGNVSVPNTGLGFQQARSGAGFAGIHLYTQSISDYREYIEIALTGPLVMNVCYRFEMYINLANASLFTTPEIGAYFSDTMVNGINDYHYLSFIPQVNNVSGNSPDTLNWILVTADYVAQGGEQYLIIGNFKSDVNTVPSLMMVNSSAAGPISYVYIDDVSLTECPKGINEQNKTVVTIYPNPASDQLNIQLSDNDLSEIIFYDVTSRKVLEQNFIHSTTVDIEQLANGIYFYKVINKAGITTGKIIKQSL